jgi:hypothetical protein
VEFLNTNQAGAITVQHARSFRRACRNSVLCSRYVLDTASCRVQYDKMHDPARLPRTRLREGSHSRRDVRYVEILQSTAVNWPCAGLSLPELADRPSGNIRIVDAMDMTEAVRSMPSELVSSNSVIDVTAAYKCASALLRDGQLVKWHVCGMQMRIAVPSRVQGRAITPIGMGYLFDIVVLKGGVVDVWLPADMTDDYGLLTIPPRATARNVVAVAAGWAHAMAMTDGGAVIAWGSNTDGQTNVPATIANGGAVAVAAAFNTSMAVTADGYLVQWGKDMGAQGCAARPSASTSVDGAARVVAVAAGSNSIVTEVCQFGRVGRELRYKLACTSHEEMVQDQSRAVQKCV